MAKVVTLNPINPTTFEYQDYSAQDDSLIVNFQIEPTFDPLQNYVAYFIYDFNNNVVFTNEIDFKGYAFLDGQVVLDPEKDLEAAGYDEGQYNVVYNFLNNELSSSFFQRLYIDQISSDRTEIRLNTTQIPNQDLINGATSLINQIQSNPGVYFDFFIDFGNNQLAIANNMLLDTSNPEDPTVLVKLYEPLPINFVLKDECWVVTEVANPVAYNINITQIFEFIDEGIQLKGPNYNLGVKDQINNSTDYITYNTVTSSSYATGSGNLQYQVNSILAERGIEINTDYSDYSNFIYFSSALTRLENFYYKLQLIEEYSYSASLSNLAGSSAYIVTSKNIWEEKINEIITTFDGYDYFLYYDSGSASWPKTNSVYPYNNVTTNSVAGIAFIQSQSVVAGEFDENNNNALINSIPEFLRNDSTNAEYELFIEMLGEMFDNIWIYYQDVTNKWDADNRLQYGVSKDLVADVLRDLGLKIYQSSFGSADLYTALLGVTPSGSLFPFPYMTGSLPTPTGFEYINTSISASDTVVPLEDIEKGTYKRLYHNLPMLLKKKGTTVGIQDLVTAYGIPSTILRVAEFGGKDKDETNDWDYYKQRYNYKLDTGNNPSITTEWTLNSNWGATDDVPNTLQFRFKLPSSGSTGAVNYAVADNDTVLWSLEDGSQVALVLEYTGSGFASGSYSGSIIDPFYQYGTLKFTADGLTTSASVYLPFFNGEWWSVMVSRTGSDYFTLYAADNIYNGDDGSSIGFITSSSYTDGGGGVNWIGTPPGNSYFGANGDSITLGGNTYITVSGSYQEIRYYTVGLSSSAFEDYTMNPDSIEGNSLNSAPDQLAFRASLGGELYTGSVSIHPKVTGSWTTIPSFTSDSNFNTGSSTFTPNVETVYLDQPAAGIKNIVSNKIQIVDMNLPSGSTLSQYRSIQQQPPGGSTYTENLAYTEVAFSPQNEINDDIMDQLGFFNMGEFIGDPRQRFTQAESYPDLDALRNAYFEKYISNYDLNDYIRLIKFFDNSLFKMIKDFTPARSSLASGVVVKQTLLERNKYPQPEVEWAQYEYSGSIDTAFISGGAGGSVNNLNSLNTNPYYVNNVYGVTQSWQENIVIPSGIVTQTHDSQDEFYNGEFSGSEFVVENGELNEANPFKQVPTTPTNYTLDLWGSEFGTSENTFLNTVIPSAGTASFWSQNANALPLPGNPDPYVKWVKIYKDDLQGNDNSLSLQYLESFVTNYFKTRGPFIIISISPRNGGDYYVLEFAPGNAAYSFPGPPVGNVTITNQQVVLNPYLTSETGPFQNSDYNAIINNAVGERLSEWYQQVDYATAQTVPVNFQQIISGTAYPAAVQDSNYTSYQYSGIRYWGSKNTTDNFNITSTSIGQAIEINKYPQRLGLNPLNLPSVSLNRTYIGYFNSVVGTDPELGVYNNNKTSYNLRYYIDEFGNTIKPINDSRGINLGIMNQNWTEGTLATSLVTNPNNSNSSLNGSFDIFKSGKVIEPILYSQYSLYNPSGSTIGYDYTSSIGFQAPVGSADNILDWGFNFSKINNQTFSTSPLVFTPTPLTFPSQNYYNNIDGNFSFNTTVYDFNVDSDNPIKFKTNLVVGVQSLFPLITTVAAQFAIQLSTNGGTTWSNLLIDNITGGNIVGNNQAQIVINPGGFPGTIKFGNIEFETGFQSFSQNDLIRVSIVGIQDNNGLANTTLIVYGNLSGTGYTDPTSYFTLEQSQAPGGAYTASVDYWTTGSVTSTVLTGSSEISEYYGLNLRAKGIENSGFKPISYNFQPQPYDEIRFEAVEGNSYKILDVKYSGSLFLTLDRPVNSKTNIDYFLIRRYIDDPAFLILNTPTINSSFSDYPGVIKPEYLLNRVEDNINNILQTLEEKRLIGG
jgi:hypothetical protein